MNKGTLFIAPPGTRNKKEVLFKEIISLYPENDFSPVLYLAPNISVLSAVKKQFFSYLKNTRGNAVYIPFQASTIKQLALHHHETPPFNSPLGKGGQEGGTVISARIRTLILCEILRDKNIGYAQLLSDLFEKMKHYILDKDFSGLREDFRQLIFEEKTLERAVKALEVLQSYESFLKEKKLIDPEDMLKDCISVLRQSQRTTDTLMIDGFFDPTPLEMEIIKTLIQKTNNVFILAEEDTELLKYFESHQEGLTTKKLEHKACRENTGYYSWPSMEEEVEGIAKGIKKLIIDGIKPWEITICFPVVSQYLPMLRRIFRKHAVPLSIGGHDLSATKPFAAMKEIIACITEDYPRSDFLSLVTSPCLPLVPDTVKKWAVTYSYRAGTVKGKQSWLSIKDIILNSAKGDKPPEDDRKRLAEFQKGIRQVIDALEDLKQMKDIISFVDAFEITLNKFGFFDYLDNPHPLTKEEDDESPTLGKEGLGGVLSEVSRSITEQFSELRNFAGLYGTARLERSEFSKEDYLMYLLHDLKVADENTDGVKVLPVELAAGLETKVLFFGGALEGTLPSRPGIDPILPEKVKRELGMPHLEYYLNRQKSYFRRLLNVPEFEPYFSCPSADGDKVFLPSPFLDWENKLTPEQLNIFTEEDALVKECPAGLTPNIFRGEEICYEGKALALLRKRTAAMSRGYFRVTDIDFYRKCPLRFYIDKVLGLEMETPPRFEVESRLWGSLAHKTMELLFKDKDIELDDLEKRLFSCLDKSLEEFPIGDFWSRVAKEIFRKLLPLLKEQETGIRMEGFSPCLVEENIKAEIGNIRLKGKIDRVDKKRVQVPPLTKVGTTRFRGGEGGGGR